MEPITRVEMLIDAIVKSEDPNIVAITRIEGYLNDILAGTPSSVVPVTRIEIFLAAISGVDIEVPKPITRLEMFLAKIAGEDIDLPEPITRLEYFLSDWAEAGGGENATVTGSIPLALNEALAKALISLKQYGKIYQSATPTPSVPQDIVCNNGTLMMVDDELPTGYKRVIGFLMNNNSYWNIDDFPLYGSDTLRFSFDATDACNVIGAYSGSASGNNYSLYVGTSSNYLRYKSGAYNSSVDFDKRYDVEITPTGSHGMKVDSTWTQQEFTTPTNLCIGTTSASASSAKLKGKLYGNIEVVGRAKFIPCERVSDSVLGYYDVISETFYEQKSGYSGAVSLGYDGSHYALEIIGTPEMLSLGEQTATVANLYAVGDYADEQEIISGILTRKVGMVVLDGKETGWALSDSGTTHRFRGTKPSDCITPASRAPIASTHFKYNATGQATGGGFIGASTYWYFIPEDQTIDTSDKWKEWLAGQYAAGTPVIVLYPLAQEATEQVSPQALKTEAGDNTLTGTINVQDVQFEATYVKGVTPAPQNLFDPTKAVVGREVDATAQYGGWYGPGALTLVGSDYIPVVAGKYYEFGIEHTRGASTSGLAFYNDVYVGEEDSGWRLDYQCVGTVTLPNLKDAGYKAVAPVGATKMMFCFNSSFNPDWQSSVTVYEMAE